MDAALRDLGRRCCGGDERRLCVLGRIFHGIGEEGKGKRGLVDVYMCVCLCVGGGGVIVGVCGCSEVRAWTEE